MLGLSGGDIKRHRSREDMTLLDSKPLSYFFEFQSEPIKMHVAPNLAELLGDIIRHAYAQRII